MARVPKQPDATPPAADAPVGGAFLADSLPKPPKKARGAQCAQGGGVVKASGKRAGVAPDMNVTPLVDVCLVLLIIFMVVMPQLQGGQSEPPPVKNPDPRREEVEPLTMIITANGSVMIEDKPVSLARALDHLAKVRAADPRRKLRLRGDRGLAYGAVRDVFAACQKLGFRGIALSVTSREAEKQLTGAGS